MQLFSRSSHAAALFTGAVLVSTALFQPAPALADRHSREHDREQKSDNYKKGAVALGVLGAVLLAKGKTLPAAAVAAGAYYSYKKGRDVEEDTRFGRRDNRPNYPDYGGSRGNYGAYNGGNHGGYQGRNDYPAQYGGTARFDDRDNGRNERDNRYDERDNRRNERDNSARGGYDLRPYDR